MWLVNIQILLHIIAVVCELMVLVSNRVVLLVVNVAFPCRGVVSVAYQGCTMFCAPSVRVSYCIYMRSVFRLFLSNTCRKSKSGLSVRDSSRHPPIGPEAPPAT